MVTGTVAELMGVLAIDASQWDSSLLESRVKLEQLSPPLITATQLVRDMGYQGEEAAAKLAELKEAITLLHEQSIAEALKAKDEEARIAQQTIEDNARIIESEREKAAAIKEAAAQGAAAWKTYQESVRLQQEGEAEAAAEEQSEQEAAFQAQMDMLNARRTARLREIEEERYQANLERELNNPRAAGVGSGGFMGGYQSRMEMEALSGRPYGLMGLLSMLPQVRDAMASAFDVVLVVAVVDMLYQLGKEIEKEITEWEGWGEAAQQAWSKAETGMDDAYRKQIDYNRKLEEANDLLAIAKTGVTGHALNEARYGMDAKEDSSTIKRLQDLQSSIQKNQLGPLEERVNAYDRIMGNNRQETPATQAQLDAANAEARTYTEDVKTVVELREREKKILEDISNLRVDQINKEAQHLIQLNEENTQHEKALQKLHDPIHELPYRLPWWMGSNPAQDFLGGGGMDGFNRGQPWGAPSGPSIHMPVNNNLEMNFDGVPADMESALREQIEPAMLEHFENNSRGMLSRLHNALGGAGMTSNV